VLRGYLRADFADAWSRFLPRQSVTSDEVLQANPNKGNGCNTLSSVTLCAGGKERADDWNLDDEIAALDADDPQRGLRVAQLRAEHIQRQRNAYEAVES